MPVVDHVASLPAGRAGWRGGKYSKHCSLPSALTTNVRRAYSAYPPWALGAGPGAGVTSTGAAGWNSRACGCSATTGWAAPSACKRWPGSPRRGTSTSAPRSCSAPPLACGSPSARPWRATRPLAGHHRDCERQARQALGEAAYQAAYRRGAGPARRRCPRLRPRAVAGEAAGRPRCPTGRR